MSFVPRSTRRRTDPFIKRSTLRYLTMGETPSVRAVAIQLHCGMVTAASSGEGSIHASWKEVAAWSGVSYASVKRAVIRLRQLGWVRELGGHRIVFDYSRSQPRAQAQDQAVMSRQLQDRSSDLLITNQLLRETEKSLEEKAQIDPRSYMELETLPGRDNHPPTVTASPSFTAHPPAGVDVPLGAEEQKTPSVFSVAVQVVVSAGADRAGAVKAIKSLGRLDSESLAMVQRVVAAVQSMPVKPYRPGGLVVAAVQSPRLRASILRGAQGRCAASHDSSENPQKPSNLPPYGAPFPPGRDGHPGVESRILGASWRDPGVSWSDLDATPEELAMLRRGGVS